MLWRSVDEVSLSASATCSKRGTSPLPASSGNEDGTSVSIDAGFWGELAALAAPEFDEEEVDEPPGCGGFGGGACGGS